MKKLIFAFAAVALIASASMAGAVFATGNDDHNGREKISGPSEIRNFRDIIKEGKDMFGIRMNAALEKISNPGEIRNFEGIMRKGNSLWGHRKEAKSAMVSAETRVCVAAAITKKDTAVKTGLSNFTSSTNTAIDARTSCQINAIGLSSALEQQNANTTCTMNYKASAKTNLKALGMARDNAWKTYKTEIKACSPASAEIKIEDGGNLEDAL